MYVYVCGGEGATAYITTTVLSNVMVEGSDLMQCLSLTCVCVCVPSHQLTGPQQLRS